MTAVHRREPIYKCGYCDKRFDKKSAIVLHIKAHGDIQASGILTKYKWFYKFYQN